MFNYLKARLLNSPLKEDRLLEQERTEDGVKNAQFVSFLQQSGFRKRALNRHQKTKRIKKLVAFVFMWAVVLGFAWIAFESSEALELF